jgi:hypothetical protein
LPGVFYCAEFCAGCANVFLGAKFSDPIGTLPNMVDLSECPYQPRLCIAFEWK